MKTKCLHYAYPSSPAAVKYGFPEIGCYYITIADHFAHHKARPVSPIWPGTPGNRSVAMDWLTRIGLDLPVDSWSYSRK